MISVTDWTKNLDRKIAEIMKFLDIIFKVHNVVISTNWPKRGLKLKPKNASTSAMFGFRFWLAVSKRFPRISKLIESGAHEYVRRLAVVFSSLHYELYQE